MREPGAYAGYKPVHGGALWWADKGRMLGLGGWRRVQGAWDCFPKAPHMALQELVPWRYSWLDYSADSFCCKVVVVVGASSTGLLLGCFASDRASAAESLGGGSMHCVRTHSSR